ncbi:MAG: SDR family oxidoreductase [Calditrichaeota bacterium]|nr:SDR family oxidoreductase [Calditrichota bacterium]
MNLANDLSGKTVLVTGSSRGIGRACAKLFAECGCRIGIHYTQDISSAKSLQKEISVESHIFQADLLSEEGCRELVNSAGKTFGTIDILVINHGVWERGDIDKITQQELDRTIDLNLKSIFYLTREALPYFPDSGGAMVFIASTAGQRGEPHYSHYAASKGGVISLTKSLAVELAPRKIRVNCVAPGWVMTDMTRDILSGEYLRQVEAATPLNRVADPEDIAPAVLFLASNFAGHITGEILNVNGGSVLCG